MRESRRSHAPVALIGLERSAALVAIILMTLGLFAASGDASGSSERQPSTSPTIGEGILTDPSCGPSLFPTPPEPELPPRGADRYRPETAKRLIRGQTVDYGVWVDRTQWNPSWSFMPTSDLLFIPVSGRDFGAYTVAMERRGSVQEMNDIFLKFVEKRGGQPSDVKSEVRRINGNDFLCSEFLAVWNRENVRMLVCAFSGDAGAIAFVGYEPRNVTRSPESDLDRLFDGIVISPSPTDGIDAKELHFSRPDESRSEEPMRVDPLYGVDPPILRTRVEPVYPEEARRARETGITILEGVISSEGCVQRLFVLQPTREPLLDAAAIKAVQQWEYQPAMYEGKPVPVFLTITVNWQLH